MKVPTIVVHTDEPAEHVRDWQRYLLWAEKLYGVIGPALAAGKTAKELTDEIAQALAGGIQYYVFTLGPPE